VDPAHDCPLTRNTGASPHAWCMGRQNRQTNTRHTDRATECPPRGISKWSLTHQGSGGWGERESMVDDVDEKDRS